MSAPDPRTGPRVAALFDLDWTLLAVNSGALWVARERRVGRISARQHLRALLYLLAYRVNIIDMEHAMRQALQTVKGEREEVVRGWTREWYYEEVAGRVAPGARRALAAHRAAGHRLVLLSSTSPYEAECAVEHLGLDAAITSRYEVRGGVFTGAPELPICYGAGKVHHAEAFATRHGVDLAASFFYTDSASDLPMLRRVGNPRAVNPDLRLRLHAWRRGWPILDWRGPSARESPLPGVSG